MSDYNESVQVDTKNFDYSFREVEEGESTFQGVEPSEWRCIAFGVSYSPVKGHHPNWFHRQMCWLLLGVRWVKDVENK